MSLALAISAGASAGGTRRATATIVDGGGAAIGWAMLLEDGSGRLTTIVLARGLTPGKHGIHIHAIGTCSPTFAAAGPHHNPTGATHGLHSPTGPHSGDSPNLAVSALGLGLLVSRSDRATLSPGPLSVLDADGSAIVIHANEDDQVTDSGPLGPGNSGAQIACGVIDGH
jgi:Cu-Zn family superoxide dismutase